MRRRGPEEFMRDPVGAYVQGRSFMVWAQTPRRFGATHRSPLDPADQATANLLVTLPMSSELVTPFDMFHDLSAVEVIDRSAFDYAKGFLERWIDALVPRTRRIAVVRPTGIAGAAFTGMFHDWVQPRFEAKLCGEREEAYGWLEITGCERHQLDAIHAEFTRPELLQRVQEALERDLRDATVERLANALALSVRSLQRRFTEQGTSFSDELTRARLRAAEVLLIEASTKIEVIAQEVGFRSAPAFTAMFRRAHGESPSEFRDRSRN